MVSLISKTMVEDLESSKTIVCSRRMLMHRYSPFLNKS